MKNSLRGVLALVMLAGAMLACGLPLPTALLTDMPIPPCAADEPADTCALRQSALENLAGVQALSVESFDISLDMDNEGEVMVLNSSGRYSYTLNPESAAFGADIHLWVETLTLEQEGETEAFDSLEIIIIGEDAYYSEDGGATWKHDMLELETNLQLGLSMFLGLLSPLTGEMNLFASPDAFTVQIGKAADGVQEQTLTVDFESLVGDSASVMTLLEQAAASDEKLGMGLGLDDLGEPEEVAMMAGMILGLVDTLGYEVHYRIDPASSELVGYAETFALELAFDAESGMQVQWELDATLGAFDTVEPVVAPAEYTEGNLDDIIGSPLN